MNDAWGNYKNGQIPLKAMTEYLGTYLKPDVAKQFRLAVNAAAKESIRCRINGSTGGYRPLGASTDFYVRDAKNTSTKSENQWFTYGVYKRGGALASYPGTSNHGWGTAIDITPGRENVKLKNILAKYGFTFPVHSESWHIHYVGGPAPIPDATATQKKTWKGLQGYLKTYWGYKAAIDGIAGEGTWTACQKWLKAQHAYSGKIDGTPGPLTYAAMDRANCKLR